MSIELSLSQKISEIVNKLYNADVESSVVQIQNTLPEFTGDLTCVVFPFLRFSKKNPVQTGEEIGALIVEEMEEFTGFNVIKGFLNLELSADNWGGILNSIASNESYGAIKLVVPKTIMVEYSSPNTNKPLRTYSK